MSEPILPLDAIVLINTLVTNSRLPMNKWNIGWTDQEIAPHFFNVSSFDSAEEICNLFQRNGMKPIIYWGGTNRPVIYVTLFPDKTQLDQVESLTGLPIHVVCFPSL